MTLNTHSLVEDNYKHKLSDFVNAIAEIKPDIIALQEVNQTVDEKKVSAEKLDGYFPCCEDITINEDNHIYNAVKLLHQKGIYYYWSWLPLKRGYDVYDEGISIMSRFPICKTKVIHISKTDDYNNWKTRKILGIKTEGLMNQWFFSVHYGWWNDIDEPFEQQWKKTLEKLPKSDIVWLMGDFNSPAALRNESYDMIKKDGWFDSYTLAADKDNGITVGKVIDGWNDKISDTDGMRIDQIWCSKKVEIISSKVIFNGVNKAVISDHYGVLADYRREVRL